MASRVLNDDASLRARPLTRERVLRQATLLDYRPSHAARSLRLSKSQSIGLFLPDLSNPVVAEILRGVEDGANANDVQVLLGRIERLERSGEALLRLIGESRVDGLLVQLSDGFDVKAFESLTTDSTPVVLLQSRGTRPGSVVLDDAAGAAAGTRHLLDLGHTEIGWIGGLARSQSAVRRRDGYLAEMRAADIKPRPSWMIASGYRPEQGREAVSALLAARRKRPTGVVVANLNAAAGVLAAAREAGLSVPADLSIVAIHDTWIADYLFPKLTTVSMPLYQLGREGLDMITSALGGGTRDDKVITEPAPALRVRDSTAPPPR